MALGEMAELMILVKARDEGSRILLEVRTAAQGAAKGLEEANVAAKGAARGMEEANVATKGAAIGFEEDKAAAKQLAFAFEEANGAAKGASRGLEEANAASKGAARGLEEANAASKGVARGMEEAGVASKGAARGLGEASAAAKAAAVGMKEDALAIAVQKGEMKAWNEETKAATSAVSTGFLLAGAAVGIGALASLKMAADFESSTNRLMTSAGEAAGPKGIDLVRTGMLKMAGDVGYSTSELSKGMYVVESASFRGADGLKVLRAAAEGAKTENAELKVVADAATTALRDYHLGADDAAMVTSKMVAAVSDGKTTFAEFTGSLHSVLPIASAANIGLSDILASVSAMTLHGMSADQATQNLAHTIQHLQTVTAPQAKELAALGISARDLSDDLGKKGLTGTLQEIAEAIQKHMGANGHVVLELTDALKKLPPEVRKLGAEAAQGTITQGEFMKATKGLSVEAAGQAAQFATLLKTTHGVGQDQKNGTEIVQAYAAALKAATGDSTTLNTALMLTGENADITNTAVRDVSGATVEAGNHVKGWGEVQSTFNNQLDRFKSGAEAAAIQLGTRLLPAASQFLKSLAEGMPAAISFANKLIDIGQAIAPLIPWIATAIGLFIAWKTAMTIGTAIQAALTFYKEMNLAIALGVPLQEGMTASQWQLNLAMDANPVGLIVLGIAALIAIVVVAIVYWKQITAALMAAWNWVHNMVESHKQLAGVLAMALGPIGWLLAAIYLLITHWKEVTTWVGIAWDKLKQFALWVSSGFVSIWTTVRNAVGGFFSWLGTEAHNTVAAVGNAFSALGTWVHNALVGVVVWFIWLKTEADRLQLLLWTSAQAIFKAGVELVTGTVRSFVNAIVGFFSWLYDHNYYFKDLVDFIRNAFQSAYNGAVVIWTLITTALTTAWNGIVLFATVAWSALSKLITDKTTEAGIILRFTWDSLTSWLSSKWSFISTVAAVAWNALTSLIRQKTQDAWGVISSVWNAITGWLGGIWGSLVGLADSAWNAIVNAVGGKAQEAFDAVKGPLNQLAGWFGDLASQAWQWGANLITQLVGGIAAHAGEIADAAKNAAGGLANFLGFHSPTKEGPGREADKWMPNLIAMMAGGLSDGTPAIRAASARVASAIGGFDGGRVSSVGRGPGGLVGSGGGGVTIVNNLNIGSGVITSDQAMRQLVYEIDRKLGDTARRIYGFTG